MVDKLRRVARRVGRGLCTAMETTSILNENMGSSRHFKGLVSLDGTCATPAGLIGQCRRMAAGLFPD
jgi:hypothetical protein